MTLVIETRVRAGFYRAHELATGVQLGTIQVLPGGQGWQSSWLGGREGIAVHRTLEGVLCELGLWCDRNPDRMGFLHRDILAARSRATSPEPVEPAPVREMQGAMGI